MRTLLWVLLMTLGKGSNEEDVFASSAHLVMLDEGERELVDTIKSHIIQSKARIKLLEDLVKDVESSRANSNNSLAPTDHPVDVFHLLHRFTSTWKEDIVGAAVDSVGLAELRLLLDSLEPLFPSPHDYDGARGAILRLQRTYQLPVNDLINGTILGHRTKPMSQQMALDICLYALYRKLNDDALEWVTHAQRHLVPPLLPLQEIYHITARIYAKKGELLKSVDFVKKSLELDPTNTNYLSQIIPEAEVNGVDWPNTSEDQDRLCREFLVEERAIRKASNPRLRCVYQTGQVVPFLRAKVEFFHHSPDVVLFHNFITDSESEILQQLAKSKIKRAMVGHVENPLITEERVGKTAWFFDNTGDSIIERLSRRVSEVTGLETRHPASEALQLSNYGLGGHYSAHYDHDVTRFNRTDIPIETQLSGDRIATFMIYLNKVEAGGATVFPQLDIGVRPIKNSAIFWYNYKKSGISEPKSLHAGCPVLIGEKWVANKWIREFGQEFRRRCSLTCDE